MKLQLQTRCRLAAIRWRRPLIALAMWLVVGSVVLAQIPASPTQPPVLSNPFADQDFVPLPGFVEPDPILQWPIDPPSGYAGRSGILPEEEQENSHFLPVEDRWRIGLPEYDRYNQGHPRDFEY